MAEFEQRMLPRLPLVVKQGLDEAAARAMADGLVRSHIDARVVADDGVLAVFERAGSTRGPVPLAGLGEFILNGERYRRQGDREWSVWVEPVSTAVEEPVVEDRVEVPVGLVLEPMTPAVEPDASEPGIWIARQGEPHGPYPASTIRHWLKDGSISLDTLAWRSGLPAWVALAAVLGEPLPAGGSVPPPWAGGMEGFSAGPRHGSSPMDGRRAFPRPPALHWFVVALLSTVSFGLFIWVWVFVQSTWVKKIDRTSSATTLLLIALGTAFFGGVLAGGMGGTAGASVQSLFSLAAGILMIIASFLMANSVASEAKRLGLDVGFGGITLFFFNVFYLQGTLTWLARWKDTGQTTPKPPKAVLWWLFAVPFVVAVAAAIAIPQYQGYVIRSQVAEGVTLAGELRTPVLTYRAQHGTFPADNAALGMKDPEAIHGRYTESVRVSAGTLYVTYGDQANIKIRGRSLSLSPVQRPDGVTWQCASNDIPMAYLPPLCR
ncbi:pilin [Bacillus sp. NP157]|nr:pilin [Bacillus sp. NP157]